MGNFQFVFFVLNPKISYLPIFCSRIFFTVYVLHLHMSAELHTDTNTSNEVGRIKGIHRTYPNTPQSVVDRNSIIVVPLFKLQVGANKGSSYGIQCARQAGISKKVTRRALILQDLFLNSQPIMPVEGLNYVNKNRVEEELINFLALVNDWSNSTDEDLQKMIGMIQQL